MGHRPMHPPMGHFPMEMSPEEEVEALKKHKEMLEKRLERINERIEKLSA
jgi:chaperonin cofactor prefoldin